MRRYLDQRRLWVWMPYEGGSNRAWLMESLGERIQPEWNGKARPRRWEIARPHLQTLVDAMAERFEVIDVFLEFSLRERCDVRCQQARGDDCECSCLGVHHGGAAYQQHWTRVGPDTLIGAGRKEVHYVAYRRFTVLPTRA